MGDLKEAGLILLGSTVVDAQVTTKQTIYTVPPGNLSMIVFAVVPRNPTATLVGLVDLDLGGNANADDWIQQVSLNAFTATTDYGLIMQPAQAAGPPIVPVKKSEYVAGTAFGVKINTGSTGAAYVTFDLFGWLL